MNVYVCTVSGALKENTIPFPRTFSTFQRLLFKKHEKNNTTYNSVCVLGCYNSLFLVQQTDSYLYTFSVQTFHQTAGHLALNFCRSSSVSFFTPFDVSAMYTFFKLPSKRCVPFSASRNYYLAAAAAAMVSTPRIANWLSNSPVLHGAIYCTISIRNFTVTLYKTDIKIVRKDKFLYKRVHRVERF